MILAAAARLARILLVVAAHSDSASAFAPAAAHRDGSRARGPTTTTTTGLDIFGKAFANDASLGERENAGLSNGPNGIEATVNEKPVKAVAGQKVSQVLASARVKMTYSCRKGNCGTCEMLMNGRVEKACCAKVPPRGKCAIRTY